MKTTIYKPTFILTKQQKAELQQLQRQEDINTEDIPELGDEFFQKAVRNPFMDRKPQATLIRLDQDVLDWLKSYGKGYQMKINSILREAMLHSK